MIRCWCIWSHLQRLKGFCRHMSHWSRRDCVATVMEAAQRKLVSSNGSLAQRANGLDRALVGGLRRMQQQRQHHSPNNSENLSA